MFYLSTKNDLFCHNPVTIVHSFFLYFKNYFIVPSSNRLQVSWNQSVICVGLYASNKCIAETILSWKEEKKKKTQKSLPYISTEREEKVEKKLV